jgi:hypothetical protein
LRGGSFSHLSLDLSLSHSLTCSLTPLIARERGLVNRRFLLLSIIAITPHVLYIHHRGNGCTCGWIYHNW